MENHRGTCTAFIGTRRIVSGDLSAVAKQVKTLVSDEEQAAVMIFDDTTCNRIEVDFRGTTDDVLNRLTRIATNASVDSSTPVETAARPSRGRPKLGVVAREVTLLPRHWDWLSTQEGGASVALRKLVEQASRANADQDQMRQSREATYRFMSAMAGNYAGFEEATRALFANAPERFNAQIEQWPDDIRIHVQMLSRGAFSV
ncbi:DUF2239 family protein [Noviherbaspirillum cavernae]|uniref:DUF2239 family protein n=1 Tax=Noviherbaspirillum cavernae TaxID=2320862 RepID=A0A418X5Z8_9BURK|nr:DUF2239 family protein [Noviherbaspirillum cavernae]RJG07912.1 DUF2239 family protein [Noviherbaspirillum cavernae]